MAGRFRTAFRETFRILHTLTQEVLGALFIALAILFGAETVRQYQMFASGRAGTGWVIVAFAFTVLMLGFGIQSFWKARRIRR
jgi:hypothetical protein